MATRTFRALALVLALSFLSVGCSEGGGGKQSTPTAMPTPTATLVLKATPAPMPGGSILPRPGSIEEYPAAIAAYLNDVGDAALGPPCLADLLAAWQMLEGRSLSPGTSTGDRCVLGDTDDDTDDEVIVSLSWSQDETSPIWTQLVVFDRVSSGYSAVFQTPLGNGTSVDVPFAILATGDLNGDGDGDLAFAEIECGAHTCTSHIHIVTGTSSGYRELTPRDGLIQMTADVRIEDINGDGTKEIIMHGGIIQSAGAGPQRARTDVYAWDGARYVLKSSMKDASDVRYFRVQDGDTAFASGDYGEAARLYEQAVNDSTLKEVGYFGSRDELKAYALFRLGLAYLKLGDASAASDAIESAIANYPLSLHGEVALNFRNAAEVPRTGLTDLTTGCQAATALINQNLARFQQVWAYGYGNREPAPDSVCPF